MLRTLVQFAVLFTIPLVSLVGAQFFGETVTAAYVNGTCFSATKWSGDCALLGHLPSLERVAQYALLAAAAPIVLFLLLGALCGSSRRLNAAVFPFLVPVALFFAAVNLFVQGGLLLMDLYAAFSYATGWVSYLFLRLAAVALIIGVFLTIMTTFFAEIESPVPVRAALLTPRRGRPLLSRIAALCDALQVAPPSQVIIGLEPATWATASPVQLAELGRGGRLEGMTLHVSITQLRVLGDDAVTALIASELAKFRPRDRAYSQRFLPLWSGLAGLYRDRSGGIEIGDPDKLKRGFSIARMFVGIASVPMRATLGLLATCFGANARRIARARTRRADLVAASVLSAETLGAAVVGAAALSPLWKELIGLHLDRAGGTGGDCPAICRVRSPTLRGSARAERARDN